MFLYFGLCRNQTFNVTSCLSLEEASVLLFLQFPFHPGLSSSNPSPSAIGAACSFIKISLRFMYNIIKLIGLVFTHLIDMCTSRGAGGGGGASSSSTSGAFLPFLSALFFPSMNPQDRL